MSRFVINRNETLMSTNGTLSTEANVGHGAQVAFAAVWAVRYAKATWTRSMVFYSAMFSPNVLDFPRGSSTDSLVDERANSPVLQGDGSPKGLFPAGESASSSTACTENSVGSDFDHDAELPLRLPAQVIAKFLELYTFVAEKAKKRRLREALLASAAQLELSNAKSSADRDEEKLQRCSQVQAEIRLAVHTDEIGLVTSRIVCEKSNRDKATSVGTCFGPAKPLLSTDVVDVAEVGGGNNNSVLCARSNLDSLAPKQLSSLVHQMTGEAQVRSYEYLRRFARARVSRVRRACVAHARVRRACACAHPRTLTRSLATQPQTTHAWKGLRLRVCA